MDWIYWILIIIFVLSLVSIGITAYRFRKFIQTGWFMLKAYRQLRQNAKPAKKTIENNSNSTNSPLVRCAKCQKWVPQDEGIKLKSNYFCSHRCLEESFTAKS